MTSVSETTARLLRAPLIAVLLTAALFPAYWMVISSTRTPPDLFTIPPQVLPRTFTTGSYEEVFLRSSMPRYFLNSFIIAFGTMLVSLVVSMPAAYGLTRFRFRGRTALLMAVLYSYVFPPVLLLLPLYDVLTRLHLVNSHVSVIVTHTTITVPFSVWLLRSFLRDIPEDLDEAAMVDGASRLGAFWRVVLPLSLPGLLSTGLFAFILSWNEYMFASVLLTGELNKTIPVGIAEYITSFDINWGAIMAAASAAALPVLLLFALIQRYFVRGLTAGAVKG
jgi:ABC-type glycerol-3-phosphate transport system permease component